MRFRYNRPYPAGSTTRDGLVEVPVRCEYVHAASFRAGANGRLSTYPFGAGGPGGQEERPGDRVDMAVPAFYRIGYNAGTGELWIAYDLGLTPEKPMARPPVLPV